MRPFFNICNVLRGIGKRERKRKKGNGEEDGGWRMNTGKFFHFPAMKLNPIPDTHFHMHTHTHTHTHAHTHTHTHRAPLKT